MNNKVIIALIVVVLIALVGIFAFSGGGKTDTQIVFITGSSLQSGGEVQFELKDAQGNALDNQIVTILFESDGQVQNYTVSTDSEGKGGLLLSNGETGTHNVTVTYAGDDKHNGCSASQMITIGDYNYESSDDSAASSESTSQSSSNSSSQSNSSASSSSSDLKYDSELNVHYDSNGKIVGGQNDGASYEYLKNNPPQVDEEGNLV